MWLSWFSAISLALAASLWLLLKRIQAGRALAQDRAFGASQGCEQPPRLSYSWPLALDLLIAAFRAANEGRIFPMFEKLVCSTGNTFEQVLLGVSGIDTFDPENVEAILSTQFDHFGMGVRRPTFFPLLGDGIFTQDGQAWKHSRHLIRPHFASNRAETFNQIGEAVDRLVARVPDDEPVDLQPLFFNLTLETTIFLLLGKNIDASHVGKSEGIPTEDAEFAEAFTIAQDYLAQRGRLGDLYWLIGGSKFRKSCKTAHQYVDRLIESRLLAKKAGNQKHGNPDDGFVDDLLKDTQDVATVRSQVLNILLAGRDTTACCLTWTFRLLCRHPRVLAKLRKEIADVVGQSPPTQQDIKQMRYLSFVLKEVLRLYPSVPINSRTALRTTTLPVGGGADGKSPVLLRQGTAVGYSPYIMHRRTDLFGDDAKAFRPERWENDFEKKVGWAYVPFNGGPRICLGQLFALLEASYTVVRLLQVFPDLAVASNPEASEYDGLCDNRRGIGDERQHLTLVVSCAEGCWIKATK